MMPVPIDDLSPLRLQIAALAARLIVQDGADYASAKRKAARQLLGERAAPPHALPDNLQIEAQVRHYQALFHGATQPARLRALRTVALEVMEALSAFSPHLCGAALNGTAGIHDGIELQLFADNPKDVAFFLLDRDIQLDLSETPHFKGRRHAPVETVSFLWGNEEVRAELYDADDLRGALKTRPDGRPQRADAAALRALMAADGPDGASGP